MQHLESSNSQSINAQTSFDRRIINAYRNASKVFPVLNLTSLISNYDLSFCALDVSPIY